MVRVEEDDIKDIKVPEGMGTADRPNIEGLQKDINEAISKWIVSGTVDPYEAMVVLAGAIGDTIVFLRHYDVRPNVRAMTVDRHIEVCNANTRMHYEVMAKKLLATHPEEAPNG